MKLSLRPSRPWSSLPAALAFAALAVGGVAGCGDDDNSLSRTGAPSLQVRGFSQCGGNLLPVATLDDLQNDTLEYARIDVTGIDPERSSGAFEAGTAVKLYVGNNAGAPGGSGLRFRSTVSDGEPQGKTVADLVFAGDSVEDGVFCDEVGTHRLYAYVERYERTGAPIVMPKEDGWPIRCIPKSEWLCDCQDICDEPTGGADAATGGATGGSADAAAGGATGGAQDAAPPPSRFQIAYDEPRGDALTLGTRANVSPNRPSSVILRWKVTNNAVPVTRPIRVTFEVVDNTIAGGDGAVRLEPTEVLTEVAQGAEGIAATVLQPGNRPGQLKVKATAYFPRADSDELDTQEELSPEITIISGLPSADEFTFGCEMPLQPAYTWRYHDPANERANAGDRWLVGLGPQTNCVVALSDRLRNRVPVGTTVRFTTEAGSIGGGQAAVAFTGEDGTASSAYAVSRPFPADTTPFPYEAGFSRPAFDSLRRPTAGQFVYNPRDGLVRVVASTRGEESFIDVDGDLQYNPGVDSFVPGTHDLGEPYIDVNDNNAYDEGEPYEDVFDNDGAYTPGNGEWDAETQIWASTTLVWLGALDPLYSEFGTVDNVDCYNSPNTLCGRGVPRPVGGCRADMNNDGVQDVDVIIPRNGAADFVARLSDVNGNCLDSRDSGKAGLEVRSFGPSQPPIFASTGTASAELDLTPLCFFNGVPEQSVSLPKLMTLIDTNMYDLDDPPALELGTIAIAVEHDLPAAVEKAVIRITYCTDFGGP